MMKTKLLLGLMAMACCFVSCNKNEETPEVDGGWGGYYGFPCHAHNLLTIVGEIPSANTGNEIKKVIDGDVKNTELAITTITYDSLDATVVPQYYDEATTYDIGLGVIQMITRDANPKIEKVLDEYNSKTRAIQTPLQYRFEGVTSFGITADKEFNGIAAGKELTHCFHIVRYSPSFVFNSETYELSVYDEWRTDDISSWLAMKPLAQPGMTLMLKEGAYCTVNDIAFTVTMTLTGGRVLRTTTPVVNIVE